MRRPLTALDVLAAAQSDIMRERVRVEAEKALRRWADKPCECPRPENASGDRECLPCKARAALRRMSPGGPHA